jgi:ABC-2 type transport system permease protein
MKTTYTTARLEWSNLFYSPVAWIVLIIFTFQTGLTFTGLLERSVYRHHIGYMLLDRSLFLFSRYGKPDGLFKIVQSYLYLYVPLLTMGLISREKASGSYRLLQSSPVTATQIVLGKFAAMAAYGLLLMAVLCIYLLAALLGLSGIDVPFFLAGLTGLYLLFCVYSAIGLLMSSLTTHPAIAAICTLALLALLNYSGTAGQEFFLVRKLTELLQLPRHATNLLDGLVTSRDTAYFLLLTGLFLVLTIVKLKGDSGSFSLAPKAGIMALASSGVIFLIWLSALPQLTLYSDWTANQLRTLSPASREIVRKIRGPLTVHGYVNIVSDGAGYGLPENWLANEAVFAFYQRYLPPIHYDYIYYYDSTEAPWLYRDYPGKTAEQIARRLAERDGLSFDSLLKPAVVEKIPGMRQEKIHFVRQLDANGGSTYLRMFDDVAPANQPQEADIAVALKRLIGQSPPRAIFLSGNGERAIDQKTDYSYWFTATKVDERSAVINQGFDVAELSADSLSSSRDSAVVVLADPRLPFTGSQLKNLNDFLADGGNMLITAEPQHAAVVRGLFAEFGLQIDDSAMIQPDKRYPADLVLAKVTAEGAACWRGLAKLRDDSAIVTMQGTSSLKYNSGGPFQIVPILAGSSPVVLALTRRINGREQRIVVAGDADFLTQKEFYRNFDNANDKFSREIFRWLTYGEYPVDTSHRVILNQIYIRLKDMPLINLLFWVLIPGLMLVAGVMLLLRRKRR